MLDWNIGPRIALTISSLSINKNWTLLRFLKYGQPKSKKSENIVLLALLTEDGQQ